MADWVSNRRRILCEAICRDEPLGLGMSGQYRDFDYCWFIWSSCKCLLRWVNMRGLQNTCDVKHDMRRNSGSNPKIRGAWPWMKAYRVFHARHRHGVIKELLLSPIEFYKFLELYSTHRTLCYMYHHVPSCYHIHFMFSFQYSIDLHSTP